MKKSNILYILKTARSYAVLAQSMHSNYYLSRAKYHLRLAQMIIAKPDSSLTTFFKG